MAEDLKKVFSIDVDSIKTNSKNYNVAFSQGDVKTAVLNINLTENNVALDLTGKTVRASFRKVDGNSVFQDEASGITITDPAKGQVQLTLSTDALMAAGNVRGQISIADGVTGEVAETTEFTFFVRESLTNSVYFSTNDLPFVELAISAAGIIQSIDLDVLKGYADEINTMKSDIASKVSKGGVTAGEFDISSNDKKIGLNHLNDAARAAIAGTAAVNAVSANDSVVSEKIAPKAVRKYHLNFTPVEGIASKNLFNKATVSPGSYARFADGTMGTNASYSASDYIRIEPNTQYFINIGDQIPFYDVNKTYISGLDLQTSTTGASFTTPTNAAYLKITLRNVNLDILQLEKGSVKTSFEPYGNYKLSDNTKVSDNNLNDGSISLTKITGSSDIVKVAYGKNLFNKDTVKPGAYVRFADGTEGTNVNYSASDYIKIEPNTQYFINYGDQIPFYDINKVFVSGADLQKWTTGTVSSTFTTPANAAYLRITVQNTILSTLQLEKGSVGTAFEPYAATISEKLLPKSAVQAKTIHQIMSQIVLSSTTKKVKLIGDSITHGVGGTGFAQDGETTYGTFKVNTTGHCWANSFKSYMESKFNCVVNNFGTTGRNSYDLLTNMSSLIKDDDDIVICMIGTNDRNNETRNNILNSKTTLYNNLKGIIDYVKNKGKQIIIMSNIPATVSNETNNKLFHMEDVDHVIMKMASDYNMGYISVYKLFKDYCDKKNVTIDSFLPDGVHPNDAGYDIMFEIITSSLGFGTKRPGATW